RRQGRRRRHRARRRRTGRHPVPRRPRQGGARLRLRALSRLDPRARRTAGARGRRRLRREPEHHRHHRGRAVPGRSPAHRHRRVRGIAGAPALLEAERAIRGARHGAPGPGHRPGGLVPARARTGHRRRGRRDPAPRATAPVLVAAAPNGPALRRAARAGDAARGDRAAAGALVALAPRAPAGDRPDRGLVLPPPGPGLSRRPQRVPYRAVPRPRMPFTPATRNCRTAVPAIPWVKPTPVTTWLGRVQGAGPNWICTSKTFVPSARGAAAPTKLHRGPPTGRLLSWPARLPSGWTVTSTGVPSSSRMAQGPTMSSIAAGAA